CTWDYVGTFRLNSDKMWEQIDGNTKEREKH
ncbi:MAG: hypothetical protein ACI849_001577, partial [Patiriisocius sp.]